MVDFNGVRIVNMMADGSICGNLSTYLETHALPDDAQRLIYGFVRDGQAIRKQKKHPAREGKL